MRTRIIVSLIVGLTMAGCASQPVCKDGTKNHVFGMWKDVWISHNEMGRMLQGHTCELCGYSVTELH